MTRVRTRLAQERGWGLVSSILVLGILLATALPLMSLVDTQQRQSAHERRSESSFNLAEAAFDTTVFVLASEWPASSGGAFPLTCTADTLHPKCPDADILERAYAGPDYSARGWSIQVRDDVEGSEYYDPAQIDGEGAATWDRNDNAKIWVRADARAAGRDRTVVALVRRQDQLESFPRNAVTAGWFSTSNSGAKRIVDTKGTTAQPAPIAVRCREAGAGPSGCLDYGANQVVPDITSTGYAGNTAVPQTTLDRLKDRAIELGTHSETCPDELEGELVYVESGDCHFSGGGEVNSERSPGVLILARGTLRFTGSMTYYGLIYAVNGQRSPGEVVTIGGGATIRGSIAVDWGGGFSVGNSGDNLIFDDRVFPLLVSHGTTAPVQGTWRELPAS